MIIFFSKESLDKNILDKNNVRPIIKIGIAIKVISLLISLKNNKNRDDDIDININDSANNKSIYFGINRLVMALLFPTLSSNIISHVKDCLN